MNVVDALTEGNLIYVGDVGKILVLGRGGDCSITVNCSLFLGLPRKIAGYDVIGLLVLHQIQRNGGKLLACAPLNEQDVIVFRDIHQFTE